jgi:cytochrome c5
LGFCAALACALHAGPLALAANATGTNAFPAAPERDLVVRACAACHAPEMVVAKRHTADEWDDIIAKMVDRGAVANDEEQQQILEYLVKFFGPA